MSSRQDASSLATVVPEPGSASDIGIDPERPSANTTSDISKQVAEEEIKVGEQTIRVDDGNVPAPPRRPARPERRLSEFSSKLHELQTAFPDSDKSICRGILVAASNNLEAAFSGMLAISDETIRPETQKESQIERDGQLARRIALSDQRRQARSSESSRVPRNGGAGRYTNQRSQQLSETDDFQKGLNEAKESISSFWGSLKQKLSGEIYDESNENEIAIDPNIRRSGSATSQPWFSRDNGFHDNEADDRIIRNDNAYKSDMQFPARNGIPPLPARSNNAERSVNVFGDDSSNTDAIKKVDDPEPDSFFIGESDEEDLGSLKGDEGQQTAVAGTLDAKNEESSKESSKESRKDATEETPNEKEIRSDSGSSTRESAKEALTKLKLTDEGKA